MMKKVFVNLSILLLTCFALLFSCSSEDNEDGAIGPQGPQGEQGIPGQDGQDGQDGRDGENGEDGTDGQDGADGQDGQDGADGADGQNGQDAFTGSVFSDWIPSTIDNRVGFYVEDVLRIPPNEMPLLISAAREGLVLVYGGRLDQNGNLTLARPIPYSIENQRYTFAVFLYDSATDAAIFYSGESLDQTGETYDFFTHYRYVLIPPPSQTAKNGNNMETTVKAQLAAAGVSVKDYQQVADFFNVKDN